MTIETVIGMTVAALAMAILDQIYYASVIKAERMKFEAERATVEALTENIGACEDRMDHLARERTKLIAERDALREKLADKKSIYDVIRPAIKNTSHIIALLEGSKSDPND